MAFQDQFHFYVELSHIDVACNNGFAKVASALTA
jgi:hypothetical protein